MTENSDKYFTLIYRYKKQKVLLRNRFIGGIRGNFMWIVNAAEAKENNDIINMLKRKLNSAESAKSKKDSESTRYRAKDNRDTLEISAEAYELQASGEELSATSGKDYLGISRSSKDNNIFVIHFTDSAQISRTISRGYLTVNGIRIELSDEVKERLQKVDAQAQADREYAFALKTVQHDMAVAKQQGEAYRTAFENEAKMMEIARRIAKGGKVPSSDEQKLMEYSPEMYMMAKMAALTEKSHKKYDSVFEDEEDNVEENNGDTAGWKSYEVQMNVSLQGEPEVQEILEAGVDIM